MNVKEASELLKNNKISPKELYEESISKIKSNNLNSFITVCDFNLKPEPNNSPLWGIPFGVKDNFCTKDIRTTCGSQMLYDFLPPYDATVVSKLKNSGANLIGKLNMDEFGMGATGENSYFGSVVNPIYKSKVTGGSSSGCAASVGGGEISFAIGSDTGGSVRQPAAFCGCVGFKPSYGVISRFGLISFASSLDTVGIIATNPYDISLIFNEISGYDKNDLTSYNKSLKINKKHNVKIAIFDDLIQKSSSDVRYAFQKAIDKICNESIKIFNINSSYIKYSIYAYYIISSAEAASNLSRYDGIKYGSCEKSKNLNNLYKNTRTKYFGTEVKRRILIGNYTLMSGNYNEYYLKADNLRKCIINEFIEIFNYYDYIILPTYPELPFDKNRDFSNKVYEDDIYTVIANITGFPAISIPFWFENKIIGIQIIGKKFKDRELLDFADYLYNEVL